MTGPKDLAEGGRIALAPLGAIHVTCRTLRGMGLPSPLDAALARRTALQRGVR